MLVQGLLVSTMQSSNKAELFVAMIYFNDKTQLYFVFSEREPWQAEQPSKLSAMLSLPTALVID